MPDTNEAKDIFYLERLLTKMRRRELVETILIVIIAIVVTLSVVFGIWWLAMKVSGYDEEEMEKHELFSENNVTVISVPDTFRKKDIGVVEVEGHRYIIYSDGPGGGICHAGSCPCFNKETDDEPH